MQKKPSLYPEHRCYICKRELQNLHLHHIYPGSGRRHISDWEGCTVYLCPENHNMSNRSVHYDKDLLEGLQRDCQRRWEDREGATDHEAFIKVFGESFIRD